MPSPAMLYQKEMHDNIGFFATWLPGDNINIGDIGIIDGGRFRKQTSLSELDIDFSMSPEGAPISLQYTSTEGTKISCGGNASGDILQSKAEISIDFSKTGAFLFHALNVRHFRMEGLSKVTSEIIKLFDNGNWHKGWHLIDSQHVADTATIIVSQDQSASLTLSAETSMELGSIPLADPNVKLSVASSRGKLVQIICGREIRPLYSCLRIRKNFLRSSEVIPVRGRVNGPIIQEPMWITPTIQDFLICNNIR